MAKAKNQVIAGDYNKGKVNVTFGQVMISPPMQFKAISLNSSTVESYSLMDDKEQKSVGSAIGRGIVGGALLGGVGLVAGAATAKSKDIYTISVQFKDGKKSMLELDDKVYKAFMKAVY